MADSGRAFIVTAAAGGIGHELTRRLLEDGFGVMACDISGKRLAKLAEAFPEADERLRVRKGDVGDPDTAAEIIKEARTHFPRIDGLANIAGGIAGFGEDLIDRPVERITVEEFEQGYRLNVQTAFVMTQAALPLFQPQAYGKVVNVASLAAFGNFDDMGNTAYDAAKAAVIGLTRSLSRSLGPSGIRVNVVAPGSVYTEKVRKNVTEAFLDRQVARIPLGKMPEPDDVAAVLQYLLLPGSDLISGEVVRVSGGLR